MERITSGFAVAAAHLIEAACRARDGDCQTAHAFIAHAVAVLEGRPAISPTCEKPIRDCGPISRHAALASWQVKRVASYIDTRLAVHIPISDLSALLELSKSHFCRAFKSTVGVTPHTWVMRRRIESAQALLLTTNATLSDIALSCGMSDQSHFTRTFRRIVGETPNSWRRSRRDTLEGHVTTLSGYARQAP